MKFLNRLSAQAAFIVTLILALTCLVFWLCSSSSYNWAGLWLNLSAGFFVSLCTIFFIDRLIKQQKAQEELPLRLAMYRDVQVFASRFFSLWEKMYIQSVTQRMALTVEQLFSNEVIEQIYESLDLEGKPSSGASRDWFSYIDNSVKDLIERGNHILDRYAFIAEPRLFYVIHHLINDSPFIGILSSLVMLHTFSLSEKYNRLPTLHCYNLIPDNKDYEAARSLFSWCKAQYDCLIDTDNTIREAANIVKVTDELPTSIMTKEKKARFSIDFPIRRY